MANKVRIGLLGAGRIGKLHGENLAHAVPNADLYAVADPFMNDATRAWAADMGIEKCYDDPEMIFGDPTIEAVFICSSTATHADFIMRAAQTGKHIFCEKPIDTKLAKIEEALAAVKKAGVKLQVGFVRRFDHNHKAVRDTVASGKLGKPNLIKVTSRDPDHQPMSYIKVSGGIFMDMTIHDFDMVRYLAGSEVTEVTAYGAALSGAGYEEYGDVDTAIVMMKFENGALGVIDNSRAAHYGYDHRGSLRPGLRAGCKRSEQHRHDLLRRRRRGCKADLVLPRALQQRIHRRGKGVHRCRSERHRHAGYRL